MARNDDWWRNSQGHRDSRTSGERDLRDLGSHRDYGRDMLNDMRRYARGESEPDDAGRGDGGARHHESRHYRGMGPRGYTRSDERIREDVNDRLTDDPYVDASDVEVTVSGCEVTLSGTVDDRRARRRAEDVAESVSGVRYVQNNLRVGQHAHSGMGTSAGASAMAGMGTGSTTSYSSNDTETPGTPGRMNAPADLHTADTDSVTRR
ncbi:BON domain-containing protein [Azospirillum soli]|uniref:BON domain-containing protein n=1 Tax=Azospirillum soli TaxID=1304799 RepID=UPI001FE6C4C9|nr:BON domain-containing protein [Azospirillum soli]MBP2316408.1 hypothetical protein [Azospirillum soli]